MTREGTVVRALRIATSAVLLVAVVAMAVLTAGVVTRRWQAVPVLSGSMSPTLASGGLALAVAVDREAVVAGDVVAFEAPTPAATLTVHRVVEVAHDPVVSRLVTRGDANTAVDPWGDLLVDDERLWVVRGSAAGLGRVALLARTRVAQAVAFALLVACAGWLLADRRVRRERDRWLAWRTELVTELAAAAPDTTVEGTTPTTPAAGPRRRPRATGVAVGGVAIALALGAAGSGSTAGASAAFTDATADDVDLGTLRLRAPTGVVATPLLDAACSVTVRWEATAGADRHRVERRALDLVTGVAGPWQVVGEVATPGTQVQDVPALATVEYRVTARRSAWSSPPSGPVRVDLAACLTGGKINNGIGTGERSK